MTTVVTGGTGFLGRHLVARLMHDGPVRIVSRNKPSDMAWAHEHVTWHEGSVTDPDSLDAAMQGCSAVYHLAGHVDRTPKDPHQLFAVHVDGTRHVLDAARRHHVPQVLAVSTSGTIGVSTEAHAIATEASEPPVHLLQQWPYYLSKWYAEQVCFDAVRLQQQRVIVVNPSLLLGPGDYQITSTRDVWLAMQRWLTVIPSGGLNFTDVRDVAAALPAALAHGEPGTRYLMGGVNWELREFFAQLAKIVGRRTAPKPLRSGLLRPGTALINKTWGLLGRQFPVTVADVEMGSHYWYIDSSKAEETFGYRTRHPLRTLEDTVMFLKNRAVTK